MTDSKSRETTFASIRELLLARRKSGHLFRPLPDHVRDTVLALIRQGIAVNEIVRATGLNSASVHRWRRTERLQKSKKPQVFTVDQSMPTQSKLLDPTDSVRLSVGNFIITVSASGRS